MTTQKLPRKLELKWMLKIDVERKMMHLTLSLSRCKANGFLDLF